MMTAKQQMQHESSTRGLPDADRGGTLEGMVFIELTKTLAGEFAGGLLADLGATVIKVEPPEGSPLRRRGPAIAGEDALYFQSENRGKYSVCADVQALAHAPWFERLLAAADAIVEDLGPGRLEAAALSPEMLQQRHPRLCHLRISPFGQTGPLAGEGGEWPVYPSSLTAQAADRRFVAASSASWDDVFSALERLGMPRPKDVSQGRHEMERLIGALPADEAVKALRRAGLPASPVNSVADLVREPHLWSRGNLVRLSDPERGEVVTQGVVPLLLRTPGRVADWSPYPGSDNEAVLGGILGYSPQQIRCLTEPVPPDVQC